jgi:hypothetical protein
LKDEIENQKNLNKKAKEKNKKKDWNGKKKHDKL